jgi:hypothetical protein
MILHGNCKELIACLGEETTERAKIYSLFQFRIVRKILASLELVWEPQNQRGLEGLKSHYYSILNKKEILAPLRASPTT